MLSVQQRVAVAHPLRKTWHRGQKRCLAPENGHQTNVPWWFARTTEHLMSETRSAVRRWTSMKQCRVLSMAVRALAPVCVPMAH